MSDSERHDEWCVTPCDGPFRVANPQGIVPETVTGVLKDGMMTLIPSPTQDSGDGWVVKSSFRVLFSEGIAASSETTPRVQRFLDALTDHEIDVKDDYGYTVKAPFTATVLPSQNVIIVLGNGVEFGEVRGDDFTPDTAMPCDTRAILRHVWRETIREEALLNRITALEAECAEKTLRLDQIAAIIKGDK